MSDVDLYGARQTYLAVQKLGDKADPYDLWRCACCVPWLVRKASEALTLEHDLAMTAAAIAAVEALCLDSEIAGRLIGPRQIRDLLKLAAPVADGEVDRG